MIRVVSILLLALIPLLPLAAQEEALCAAVRIQLSQGLTLERQGFEGRMRIGNSLPATAITDLRVTLNFTDDTGRAAPFTDDPNGAGLFFVRIASLTGTGGITGQGTIAPESAAEIKWLIIPTAGAAGPSGTRYLVGAELSYRLAGKLEEVTVAPDFINVLPQPELQLDYFLPEDVQGDDPFTQRIEAATPFTLGVRVLNRGRGTARRVAIDSAQPEIKENDQGLAVAFQILESAVDDLPANPTLLINFGDILSNRAKVGRWLMESSLSGKFTEFRATFTHSDELGGRLTSLLNQTSAHPLIRDVTVDLPDRDQVRDFLARTGSIPMVFESGGGETLVNDASATAQLTLSSTQGVIKTYTLTHTAPRGFFFLELPDPEDGRLEIRSVVRSDGKILRDENSWFTERGVGPDRKPLFGLFDTDSRGSYTLRFGPKTVGSAPPVIQVIPDRTRIEGQRLTFVVQASDPNNTIPTLAIDQKPVGSLFLDRLDGTALFDWPTQVGQAGRYPLTFRASDGTLTAARTTALTIRSRTDSDNDGMDDDWERLSFGNLSRDGTLDKDTDSILDKQEYEDGTDPNDRLNTPTVPEILSPRNLSEVTELRPALTVLNSSGTTTPPTYDFELYSNPGMTSLVSAQTGVTQGPSATTATLPVDLTENSSYWLLARGKTSQAASEWAVSTFKVNAVNESPSVPQLTFQQNNSVVGTKRPRLTTLNATDNDGDELRYGFQVGVDTTGKNLATYPRDLIEDPSGETGVTLQSDLTEDQSYFVRAVVTDEKGVQVASPWSSFRVNTVNNAPTNPTDLRPTGIVPATVTTLSAVSTDPELLPVSYRFELDTTPTFSSPGVVRSNLLSLGQFPVTGLTENTRYYYRVKATDGTIESGWSVESFVISTVNEPPSTPTILNPGSGASVQSVSPLLVANPATDPEFSDLRYRFEIFTDETLSNRIEAALSDLPQYRVVASLQNNTRYLFRVQAVDPEGLASPWSAVTPFYVNTDAIDDPPTLTILSPAASRVIRGGEYIDFVWTDNDPDSDATITIRLNDRVITSGLSEDLEGLGDTFKWNAGGIPDGVYTLYFDIADQNTKVTVTGVQLTLQGAGGTAVDLDGDGVINEKDNCPRFSNRDQRDRGGLGTKKKDGIGDACQCGDVTGDGRVDSKDVTLLTRHIAPRSKVKLKNAALCQVKGNAKCDKTDLKTLDQGVKKAVALIRQKKPTVKETSRLQICVPARGR